MLAALDGPIDGIENDRVAFNAKLANLDDRGSSLHLGQVRTGHRDIGCGARCRVTSITGLSTGRFLAEKSVTIEEDFSRMNAFRGPLDLKEMGSAGNEVVVQRYVFGQCFAD